MGYFTGRTAVINVPGGGASRTNRQRPDLIPGVDPFIKDGGRLFLNPAAFATPQPGDLAMVAAAYGVSTERIMHAPDVAPALKNAIGAGGVHVIVVTIDRAASALQHESMWRAAERAIAPGG